MIYFNIFYQQLVGKMAPAEGHINILHVCFCWYHREHLIFTKSLSIEAPQILSAAQISAETYFRLAATTSVLD